MKRLASLTTAAGIVAGAVLAAAPAQAVTNPAANPRPITVKGDDGQTYTDGQDTLPGYDDVECSYIPGAWYDFGANRVHYADGQSISWTEWDRVPGYKAWKAKQSAPKAAAPAPAQDTQRAKAKQSAPKQGDSKQGAPKQSAPKQSAPTSGTPKTGAPAANAATTGAGQDADLAGATSRTSVPADLTSSEAAQQRGAAQRGSDGESRGQVAPGGAAAQGTHASPEQGEEAGERTDVVDARLVGADRPDAAAEEGGSAAGLLILGGLGLGAVALLGGWSVVGRRAKGVRP